MWEYQNAHCAFAWTSDAYRPGDRVGVCAFPTAPTRNLVALTGYYGQYFLLDSRTGLFVDALGEDQRSAYTLDQHMVLTENFNGSLFQHAGNGKTDFIGGDADARLWELTGLDTVQYHSVAVTVTPEQVAQAETAARPDFLAQRQAIGRQTVTLPRLKGAAADGGYDEWAQAPVLNVVMDGDRTAQVQVGYDDDNLYLLFQKVLSKVLRQRYEKKRAVNDYGRRLRITGRMLQIVHRNRRPIYR